MEMYRTYQFSKNDRFSINFKKKSTLGDFLTSFDGDASLGVDWIKLSMINAKKI